MTRRHPDDHPITDDPHERAQYIVERIIEKPTENGNGFSVFKNAIFIAVFLGFASLVVAMWTKIESQDVQIAVLQKVCPNQPLTRGASD